MLSRFVTTSRTRIINPRYVVPCTLYLLVITAHLSLTPSRILLQLPALHTYSLRAGWLRGKKTATTSFFNVSTRSRPSRRHRTRPTKEHPAIFLVSFPSIHLDHEWIQRARTRYLRRQINTFEKSRCYLKLLLCRAFYRVRYN